MKRIILLYSSYVVIILLGVTTQPVRAQGSTCGNRVSPIYNNGTFLLNQSGLTITADILAGIGHNVKNLLVIGQDPEEEGLSLDINITAPSGKVVFDEWWLESVCIDADGTEFDPSFCRDPKYHGWYKFDMRNKCHPNQESKAQREIKNIKVWIEPSAETAQWLGWVFSGSNEKAPLRYIFPDKWMAGTWTPEGFTTTGTPDDPWNTTYYENWLEQLEGLNFLAGDTGTIPFLWSVTLSEVTSPINGTQSLGLFGNLGATTFTYPPPEVNSEGMAYISYTQMRAYTKLKRADSNYNSVKPLPDGLNSVPLQLRNIPMDLPGKWYVGVMVEMEKANFEYTHKSDIGVERTDQSWWNDANPSRWFTMDEAGYKITDNYFFEFVILSAPCNPLEEKNCWDDSY